VLVAAVDTATLTLSCALVELDEGGVRLLAERTEHTHVRGSSSRMPASHSGRLPGLLVELLDALEYKLPDVEGYAVGLGPGSFTGLRIGLATWKGLAYGNQRPLVGASSLEAMALEAVAGAPPGVLLVPLLDAKKGEIYAGFYRAAAGGLQAMLPEAVLSPAALLERIAPLGWALGFGQGHEAYRDLLEARLPRLDGAPSSPPAFGVARLAAPRLFGAAFAAQALYVLEPHYLRLSEAEVKFPHGLGPGLSKP
jgi:tRNA threonylcarbamoyladenosine biosynthesis protein TsaB